MFISDYKYDGKIDNAEIDYCDSIKFSETEIKSVVDAIFIKFRDFKNCELKKYGTMKLN
jgi:hypothetical protein